MPADPPPSLPAPAQLCCQCSWLSVKQHTCSLVPPGQARMLSPCCPILSSPSLNSLLLGHSNAKSLKSQERNLSGLASPASSLTASSQNPRLSPPSLLFSSLHLNLSMCPCPGPYLLYTKIPLSQSLAQFSSEFQTQIAQFC